MIAIKIELPTQVSSELEAMGVTEHAGIADWIADAIQQKLSAARQLHYLESRASRGDRAEFLGILSKVPSVEPVDEDRW